MVRLVTDGDFTSNSLMDSNGKVQAPKIGVSDLLLLKEYDRG